MNNIKDKAVSELFQLVYIAMEYENMTMQYGTDAIISSAEIYQLKCIHDIKKANVTNLAEMLGISKSAVSQSIKKLESKQLVQIRIDAENHSRYIIDLTQKGKTAHNVHMTQRDELYKKISKVISQNTEETCAQIYDFLHASKDIIEKSL